MYFCQNLSVPYMNSFCKLRIFLLICCAFWMSHTCAQVILGGESDSLSGIYVSYSTPRTYEIGGITFSGTPNFDPKNLLFGIGDVIEIPGEKITKSIQRLWELGIYSEDINISITRIIGNTAFINVHLTDRSRMSSFTFTGTKKQEETDIRGKIKISQGSIVNDNLLKTCINTIKNYYVDKGFYLCEVNVKQTPDEKIPGAIRLEFNIEKGPRVKIYRINLIGNEEVRSHKLLRSMKGTKEKFRFAPFERLDTAIAHRFKYRKTKYRNMDFYETAGEYFSPRIKIAFKASKFIKEKFEEDKIKLIDRYNDLGYRDAVIVKDTLYFSDKKNLIIDVEVKEGPKYYFRNISWVGNSKYSSEFLSRLLNIKKGDVYNQTLLTTNLGMNQDGSDISSLYMDDGYLFFNATPVEVLIEGDSIDIEIRIREGKQARYNKITVVGNTKTNDKVIMREIRTIPGELFSRADIIRTQRELLNLRYFNQEKLSVIPKPNEADGTVDIEYGVEETSSDQLELSAGYGATGLMLRAGIALNNFSAKKFFKKGAWTPIPSGDGQSLAFRVETNAVWFQSYSITFMEPWLGGKKPNSFSVSLFYQIQTNGKKKADALRQSINIAGVGVTFANRLKWPDDYFIASHTFNYQNYNVKNYGSMFVFSNGNSNNFSYTFGLSRNSIDAPIYPRTGSDIGFSVQATPPYSLFNDKDYTDMTDKEKYKWLEFYKFKFRMNWFTNIVQNLVLSVRMKMGFMGGYNSQIGPPPFERFYLGGDGLGGYALDGREIIGMRGYENSSLTPRIGGYEVGGTIYNKFTAELRYPITLNPSATIFLLGFFEAGKAWLNVKDYSPFNLYKSAGVGVRIYLPMFGLLGFDWGYGFDEIPGMPGANKGRFHISINQSLD